MSLNKRVRVIVAMLLVLGAVIAVVLHVQALEDTTASSAKQGSMAGNADQLAEPLAFSTATPADSLANDHSAVDISAGNPDTSANAETSLISEELQRQVDAAIPRAEQPKIAPDAEYEPDVVLVSVHEGTTVEQLSRAITEAGIQSVDPNGIEAVTDDLMMARLAPGASIDDAIYDLESSGVTKGAQPNYVYEIAEELTPPADDVDLVPEDAESPDDTESAADDDPQVTIEPDLSAEVDAAGTDAVEGQSNIQLTVDAQSTSPTSARGALNDTFANAQWNLDSIDALGAWEYPPLKSATTTVGVGILDYGFGDSHEDLADNVRSTYNAPSKTENVPVPCAPGSPSEDHGSHVAGIVAAVSNNEKGISGVGFNHLKLSLLNLMGGVSAAGVTTASVVSGLDYLIVHKDQYNIRVANMSLGGGVHSMPKDDDLLNKIDEAYGAGIVAVGSAGNKTASDIPPYTNYPSDYETVIAVMNLRNTDVSDPKSVGLSSGSNYNAPGETSKNISAPGTDIYSTYSSDYGMDSGTSMAAPHVAGVVGLMFVVNPTLSSSQAKSLLYSSARDIGDAGWDETYGYGEVNAAAAVRAAAAGAIAGPEYLAVGSEAAYTVASDLAGWSFSSSNPNVLAINEDGTATAMTAGTAMVGASDGSRTIAQQVTVLGPITGNSFVAKDGSESLSITMPDGCGDLAWEWSSSNESQATVTNNGMVYGKDVGGVTITATLVSDQSVTLSHTITVYDTYQSDVYVPVGDTVTLTPDIPSGADNPEISWTSANEQAVAVNQNCEVTALSAGGAAVSCTIAQGDESVTQVWRVYTYGPIKGDALVGVGQSTQLKVPGIDYVSPELQTGWTWSLGAGSDGAVATVDQNGMVTGNKPGTVSVTATRGSGQEQVSFSYTVEVAAITLANAEVTIPRQTYSGKKLTPVPVVKLNRTTLTAGTDYEVVDQDIVNVSSYNVVIQGKGVYQGKTTGIFVVQPLRLTPPKPVTDLVYNGKKQTGVPESESYTVSNNTKTDAGLYDAVVEVKDKTNTCWENNRSTCTIEWSIAPISFSEVSVAPLDPCVYNGSAHKPKLKVTWNGMSLEEEEDYDVSYEDNVNAGTAKATLSEASENFTGTKTVTFSIVPASIQNAVVTLGDALTYTGEAQTQSVVSVRLGDVDITNFCDITGNVVTDAGDYTLTVSAKPGGNYEGSVTCPFSVAKAAASVEGDTAADVRDSLDSTDVVLTRTNASKNESSNTSGAAKLPETSDGTQSVVPIAVAGAVALALAVLRRRTCEW